MMKAADRPNPIIIILLSAAMLAAAWCTVSAHARNGHSAEMISSMDVLTTMELASTNPGACKVLVIANCLFSTIQDRTSPHYGELSPQARVYCGDHETGMMAVFGLRDANNPIYVTGYVISKARFDGYCQRDRCAIMDLTYLQWLVK